MPKSLLVRVSRARAARTALGLLLVVGGAGLALAQAPLPKTSERLPERVVVATVPPRTPPHVPVVSPPAPPDAERILKTSRALGTPLGGVVPIKPTLTVTSPIYDHLPDLSAALSFSSPGAVSFRNNTALMFGPNTLTPASNMSAGGQLKMTSALVVSIQANPSAATALEIDLTVGSDPSANCNAGTPMPYYCTKLVITGLAAPQTVSSCAAAVTIPLVTLTAPTKGAIELTVGALTMPPMGCSWIFHKVEITAMK